MFETPIDKLKKLDKLVSMTEKPEIITLSKFLYERIINHDFYTVLLGETSSGKSSIINGLLQAHILPMKACPSTAAITEIELKNDISDNGYYAINKDATIEKISKELFDDLAEHPDDDLARLKVISCINKPNLNNLRVFDTPGYGSIISKHEEVLKDFLPNSDLIVYTVNFKIGIQDEDYHFLRFLRSLVRDDVKIFLVVNRCPNGINSTNTKIKGILKIVSDILTVHPEVYIINNIISESDTEHPLPNSEQLWNSVSKEIVSPARTKLLESVFNNYVCDLYSKCLRVFEARYLEAKIDGDQFERVQKTVYECADRIEKAIPELLIPTFDRIEKNLPKKFEAVVTNVHSSLCDKIEASDIIDKEEMVNFINYHDLPHSIKTETNEIENYIDVEFNDLNRKIDDYLQKELVRLDNDLTIILDTNMDVAVSSVMSGLLKEAGKKSLESYFMAFGGMGGANAGIANAASHLLKKAGDLFGHTFTRATHNGLKHFMAKIGATSMKAVGAAVAVLTEILFLIYDFSTWRGKMKDKIKEGLDKWKEETIGIVIEDLHKLREENITAIKQIANSYREAFDKERPTDLDKCFEQYEYAKEIGKQIGIE
ncbi:MAG: dynamin family protein [Parabacteroides sp.]